MNFLMVEVLIPANGHSMNWKIEEGERKTVALFGLLFFS